MCVYAVGSVGLRLSAEFERATVYQEVKDALCAQSHLKISVG
jgi:hypothetical protein